VKPLAQQLSFEDIALRAIATDLPKIETPVFRWRKLVRRLDPLGTKPGRAAFQSVASALADYANRNGRSCRPTIARLCADTGFSERTVQYAIRELVRWRVVEVERAGGRGRASEYRLVCPGAVNNAVDKKGCTDRKGAPGDTKRVHAGAPQVRQEEDRCRDDRPAAPELDPASPFAQLALRVVGPELAESA
jgi:hypothetical protein